jgi:hypothetical protein
LQDGWFNIFVNTEWTSRPIIRIFQPGLDECGRHEEELAVCGRGMPAPDLDECGRHEEEPTVRGCGGMQAPDLDKCGGHEGSVLQTSLRVTA